MALFFTRRAYNSKTKKFTNNPASLTRYVTITKKSASGKILSGGSVKLDDWIEMVRDDGGEKGVLIYVHGFNTSQIDMLKRLDKIEQGVKANGFKGSVIAFDWPSNGNVLAYDADRRDAKEVAPHLVGEGIIPLLEGLSSPKIHIIAHSMGGLVVLRGFSDFGDSAGGSGKIWSLDQITFASADVDSAWLEKGAWGDLVLNKRSKRFTNYYSGKDRVLALADGLINGGRDRAGHSGMPSLTSSNHWDVYCDEQYLRDVPKSKRSMTRSHRWWFENDEFYEDLGLTLAGKDATKMKTRKKTTTSDQALLT